MGVEWRLALREGRTPDWGSITPQHVEELCQVAVAANSEWHADLTSIDLSGYLSGMSEAKLWWLHPAVSEAADGMYNILVIEAHANSFFSRHG
jgi:hypothetical protein